MKNTLTNIIARWEDVQRLKRGQMILPSFVDLHTSNTCNHRCVGCAYSGQLNHGVMEEEQHFAAVDLFLGIGVKAFDFAGGGEPTMIPYLAKLMLYLKLKNANYALITNGSMISDKLMDVLLEGATYVRVSLEASDRDMYFKYKRVKQWDSVTGRLREMVEERNARGSNTEISLKFSVGKSMRGINHYFHAIELANKLGVDRINFKALRHEPEELLDIEKRSEEGLLLDAIGLDAELRAKVSYWIAPVSSSEVPQCWLNPMHTVMDHLGNIYLCCFYYYRQEQMMIGNIFDEGFAELWFSDEHKAKIKAIDRHQCSLVDCKFFHHHTAVNRFEKRGMGYFL